MSCIGKTKSNLKKKKTSKQHMSMPSSKDTKKKLFKTRISNILKLDLGVSLYSK